jgi:HSP20 family molecular chaperone IbpA
MKTDVHEHEDHFEVDIDLPGFKKEDITLELQKRFTISSHDLTSVMEG